MVNKPIKYKTEWKEFSKNEEYWREVLVGRTITSTDFDDKGIESLHLDNGEVVYLCKESDGRLFIKN